ncbi:DUF998 domain-containing protein [Mariniluteicoccus flavus]
MSDARPRRLESGLLVLGVLAFVAGCVGALAGATPSFSWDHSMLSDLGSGACVERSGHRLCSPHAARFNAGLVVAGVCVLVAGVRLARSWGRVLTVAVASLAIGLVLLALVPSDADAAVHMGGAVLALPVPAAGLLVAGVRSARGGPAAAAGVGRARAVLGAAALVPCLDHLAGDEAAPVPRGVAELVSVAVLLGFLLWEAGRHWRVGRPPVRAGIRPPDGGSRATPAPIPRSGRGSAASAIRPRRRDRSG